MSNERNIHSASRPRRGMRPGRGMVPGEKAKDLKGALGKILRYMGKYKIAVVFVMIIAACSTVFSVLGPKVLGKATTGLAEGFLYRKSAAVCPWFISAQLCLEFCAGMDHDRYHTENLLPDAKRNYRKNKPHADEIF